MMVTDVRYLPFSKLDAQKAELTPSTAIPNHAAYLPPKRHSIDPPYRVALLSGLPRK
jgi:hypothetical protein